ncbi:MAG: peptidoglycan recognition family protein [Phycisphaerales bacterium]
MSEPASIPSAIPSFTPCSNESASCDALSSGAMHRRAFLALAGLSVLGGCATTQHETALPHAEWERAQTTRIAPPPPHSAPASAPVARPTPALEGGTFPGVLPRSEWAKGQPEYGLMNPMLPVRYVTVHHDGLDRLCTGTAHQEMAERIELYRVGHRAKGWGDIGYHFVIDRTGVVWEGRSLKWQGAHVKDRNEGNVGILVMGNFEIQQPTAAQLSSLHNHLCAVCTYFSVPWTRVFSHREWPGAQTLCPGKNLQVRFVAIRQSEGGLA